MIERPTPADFVSGSGAPIWPFLLVIALFGWLHFLFTTAAIGCRRMQRWPLAVLPVLGMAALPYVLFHWADPRIWEDGSGDVTLFVGVGLLWLAVAARAFAWLNVSISRDALAGRNPAAIWTCAGALLGVGLMYAGGNIGSGGGVGTTFFSAALATGTWFVLWLIVEALSHVSEAITVERDRSSGLRMGALLVAMALILGRAVAGDWVSASGTLRDFFCDGWPACVLAMVAGISDKWLQAGLGKPPRNLAIHGLLPSLFFVGAAVAWLAFLGRWK